jgi:adenylate cyclase
VDLAEYEAFGLYDPTAPNAADRRALLEWLEQRGITVAQMVEARERNRLQAAAADLLLRPGDRLTIEEVAERSGLTVDEVQELSLVAGLPITKVGAPVHTQADAELFQMFKATTAVFPEQSMRQFTRVLGSALARIADAAVALFLSEVETPLVAAHGDELALAQAQVEAIEILNLLPQSMDTLFRAHMEVAIQRNQAARAGASSLVTVFLAVGFVDLVGFTPLTQRVPVTELGNAIAEFEGAAHDLVARHGGRVVKLIGDEVMFVALEPVAACEIGVTLLEQFGAAGSKVTPRGGIAVGEVLMRGGDYYGAAVNLASRIADLAVPQEILVTTEVRERAIGAPESMTFAPAGRRMLKGFDDPVELFALGRQSGAGTR